MCGVVGWSFRILLVNCGFCISRVMLILVYYNLSLSLSLRTSLYLSLSSNPSSRQVTKAQKDHLVLKEFQETLVLREERVHLV